jgi:hypothetical protein
MTKAGTEIMEFIQPIPETHPLANPINGFYDTWRFNEGRIAYLKQKIADFDSEQDLVWGKTKEEVVNATEFPGTNTTYETKKSIWVLMLDEAIEQRIKLLALAAKLGIEKAKLESAQGLKAQTIAVILNTLEALGLDPHTDEVKAAIRSAILAAQTDALAGTPAAGVIPVRKDAGATGFDVKHPRSR